EVKGRTAVPGEVSPDYLSVSPEFFRSMGIRLVAGRLFEERDNLESSRTLIVKSAFVRRYLQGRDPLTQSVPVGPGGPEGEWCQIAGVVEDVRQRNLTQNPPPTVYVPYGRDPWPFMAIVVRTAADPAAVASTIAASVQSIDADQPVYDARAMKEVITDS